MVKSMQALPNAAIWGALLAGCKTHGDAAIGSAAAAQLMALQPGESGHYSLSVNLFAQAKDWEKVAAVRSLMKDRHARRPNPGSSWIEIGGSMHEFAADDESHHLSAVIRTLLTYLNCHLRQEEQGDPMIVSQ